MDYTTKPQNLEQITDTSKKSNSLGRAVRAVGAYFALIGAGIIGVGTTGCNAPGYHAPSDADRAAQTKYEKTEKGAEPEKVSSDLLAAIDSKETIKVYEVHKDLDSGAEKVIKKLSGVKFTEAFATYNEIKKQNEQINTLYSSAKIHRHVIRNLRQNVDANLLEKYDTVSKEDADKIVSSLNQLNVSLQNVSYDQRKKLKVTLASVQGADELFSYNEKSLATLNTFCNMIADAATLERKVETVVESYVLSANILRSTQGTNQFDFEASGNKVKGEGRKVLEEIIFPERIDNVCSPTSIVAGNYGKDGSKLLKDIYAEIMQSAWKRSQDQNYDTMHKLSQKELSSALNIGFEAYKHNVISEAQLQSVSRFITKDFLDKITSSPKSRGVEVWADIIFPLIPPYNLATVFVYGPDAFSHEQASADSPEPAKALSEFLTNGNGIKIGAWNNRNFVGDSSPAVATVWTGALSTIGETIMFYYIFKPARHHGGGGAANGTGQPPVGGGGGTTPGTK